LVYFFVCSKRIFLADNKCYLCLSLGLYAAPTTTKFRNLYQVINMISLYEICVQLSFVCLEIFFQNQNDTIKIYFNEAENFV
jgi:hypothetical protein